MSQSTAEKIERHRAFLKRENAERPLVGLIQGWENLSRYVSDTEKFFPRGDVSIEDISCARFLSLYQNYARKINDNDDLFFTLEPLPFFPWCEAAMGCPIQYTGKNFWASPVKRVIQEKSGKELAVSEKDIQASSSRWVAKYTEFIDFLAQNFAEKYPVSQSILRGPLDLAAAVFGEENMVYMFYDQPARMKEFLAVATSVFLDFVAAQQEKLPAFENGYVIGSYYVWTPGSCLRLQEDAMSLLSPELYQDFVHPFDCSIAAAAEYTLFHLHATGLHLLDLLLENQGIRIFQVSKDEGVNLKAILSHLKKIQNAKKCMIVKGRFDEEELRLIKNELDCRGLCIQAVVSGTDDSDISTFIHKW